MDGSDTKAIGDAAGVLALEENVFFRTAILSFHLGKAAAALYGPEGLTSHEWKVMGVLYRFGAMPAHEVANCVTFDKAAISRAVRRLDEKRAIAKARRPGTARITELRLTESGLATYQRIGAGIAAIQARLFGPLGAARQAAFFETLDLLEARIGQHLAEL